MLTFLGLLLADNFVAIFNDLIQLLSRSYVELERRERQDSYIQLAQDLWSQRLCAFYPDHEIVPSELSNMRDVAVFNYVLSLVWKCLYEAKGKSVTAELVESVVSESEAVWQKGTLKVRLCVPLVGLSSLSRVSQVKLDRWQLRRFMPCDRDRVERMKHAFLLPAMMAYSGANPPVLDFGLVLDRMDVPLTALDGSWNVIQEKALPLAEIQCLEALLQSSIGWDLLEHRYGIDCPLVFYRTEEWAANPAGNPFTLDYAWPLRQSWFGKEWFAAPEVWGDWLQKGWSLVESGDDLASNRYKRALRGYANSTRSSDLTDRLVWLFIAIDALLGGHRARGRGQELGRNLADLIGASDVDRRKWRKFMQRAYRDIRHPLLHEGISADELRRRLAGNPALPDPETCANLLEVAFLAAWGRIVKSSVGGSQWVWSS
ncbi:MAG TPA: hypothetical protein GXX40_08675 [Firmicutes bacterium]|nr:hypothetical protein [Bacillota bacterium]